MRILCGQNQQGAFRALSAGTPARARPKRTKRTKTDHARHQGTRPRINSASMSRTHQKSLGFVYSINQAERNGENGDAQGGSGNLGAAKPIPIVLRILRRT